MNFEKLQADIKKVAAARAELEAAKAEQKAAMERVDNAREALGLADNDMANSLIELVKAAQ